VVWIIYAVKFGTEVRTLLKNGVIGITMDLSVSYLRGIDVTKHESIVIESVVENAGNKIFFTSCKLKSLDGAETFAIGRQTLYMVPNPTPIFSPEMFE